MPATRSSTRVWIKPGTEKLMHRIGGIEKNVGTGHIDYAPENHQAMTDIRADKVLGVARSCPDQEVCLGEEGGKLAVVGWGSTFGPIHQAVRRARRDGMDVSHIHIRHIWPLPVNLGDLLKSYDRIIVPEMNKGQLKTLLRDQYLVDARPVTKTSGQPFKIAEIEAAIEEALRMNPPRLIPLVLMLIVVLAIIYYHAIEDDVDDRDGQADRQGFRHRPGGALVPRLRRLCGAEGGAADDAGSRRRSGEDGVRLRHRLLEPLSLLYGDLRLPHHPRPRAGGGDGGEARQSRSRRVDHHRRRRRAVDRRQPHDAPPAPQPRLPDTAFQQRDLWPYERPIFSDHRGSARARPRRPSARSTGRSAPAPSRSAPAARFVARAIDVHKNLPDVLKAAHAHKGAAFVEIFQNCIVYNDDVFAPFTAKENAGKQLWLKAGEPMLFDGGTKGLTLDRQALNLKVVDVVDGDWQAADVIVHDPANKAVAHMLIDMPIGSFPMALGVIYDDPRPTFESAVREQNAAAAAGQARRPSGARRQGPDLAGRQGAAGNLTAAAS